MALSEEDKKILKDQLVNYDYIRFTWPDFHGIARGKTVPAEFAAGTIDDGLGCFSGSITYGPTSEIPIIKKITDSKFCNISCKPMVKAITPLPWAGNNKYRVGEIICEPMWVNGGYLEANTRFVARKQLDALSSMGLQLMSACECEFILCKDGKPLSDGTDHCNQLRFSDFEDIMFDIDQEMRKCGIITEVLHTEYSPGQVEMAFKPCYGIKTADDMFRFKSGTKELLKKKGIQAVFMTRPFCNHGASSGTHFNHSLWYKENGKNAFYDADKEDNFSDLGKYWIGGVFKHIDAITALCSPTTNCYRRLHNPWAPDKKDWDFDNRMVTWRLITEGEKRTYMENRIPSGSSNIYIVMAATVAAGIDGIRNKIEAPPRCQKEESIPNTLEEALNALEANDVLTEALGQEFVEWFLLVKRTIELEKFKLHDVRGTKEEEFALEREEYFEMM